MNKKMKAALVASAVGGMFLVVGCGGTDNTNTNNNNTNSSTKTFKCEGGNSCKGLGECAGKDANGTEHDCAGKGDCKGQSWVNTTDEAECKKLQDANKS